MRTSKRLMMVTIAMVAFAAIASEAGATFPGGNGEIAYLRYAGDEYAVRTIHPDGSPGQILADSSQRGSDAEWSPDGSMVALVQTSHGVDRITLLDPATDERSRVLTIQDVPGGRSFLSIAFAPTGNAIAFCAFTGGGVGTSVFTVNVDGTQLTKISGDQADDCHADWSSMDRIVVSTNDFTQRPRRIVSMAPDGSDRQVLAELPPVPNRLRIVYFVVPSWSPDGSRVVLGAQRNRRYPDLFAVNADGSGFGKLTDTPHRSESGPLFSPDGSRIAFTKVPTPRVGGRGDLFAMNVDGSSIDRLTQTPRRGEYSRSWQALVP